MKRKTKDIIRWISFIPASILASEIVRFLFTMLPEGGLGIFFPLLAETTSGVIAWALSAAALIFTAYKIVPTNKNKTIKIYVIFWTVFIVGLTIFMYYMAKLGIAGSFWYPLLINVGYFVGLWFSYFTLTSRSEK